MFSRRSGGLPLSNPGDKEKQGGSFRAFGLASRMPRRLQHIIALIATLSCLGLLYLNIVTIRERTNQPKKPPNYYAWYKREKAMPQNNASLPLPQGRHGQYVRYRNHLANVGWGNAMQEMIINAHVAYKANRIFTMYNYTWDKYTSEDYATFGANEKTTIVPARIPMTALIEGPIAGGSFPVTDWRPPAVSTAFFEEICPQPTTIKIGDLKQDLQWATGAALLNGVAAKLNAMEDSCVELEDESGQIFDFWIFGDGARMGDAWPHLLYSPILTDWQWSGLVRSGVERNRKIVHPAITMNDPRHRGELPGLLALHLRRGDFKWHCENLANWRSQYNAFNVRPGFADTHNPPDGGGEGEHTPETLAYWNHHCFPEIDEIVARVQEVRADAAKQGRTLDRIYVLTNGSREWLAELKSALSKVLQWKAITTSRDLELTHEQKYVAQAVDQVIATRAEVFVGNPWSSLTSNVNLLRMAQLHNPETTRFW